MGDSGVYVGLILSKSTDDPSRGQAAWLWPRLAAWIARRAAAGTVIAPARRTVETDA